MGANQSKQPPRHGRTSSSNKHAAHSRQSTSASAAGQGHRKYRSEPGIPPPGNYWPYAQDPPPQQQQMMYPNGNGYGYPAPPPPQFNYNNQYQMPGYAPMPYAMPQQPYYPQHQPQPSQHQAQPSQQSFVPPPPQMTQMSEAPGQRPLFAPFQPQPQSQYPQHQPQPYPHPQPHPPPEIQMPPRAPSSAAGGHAPRRSRKAPPPRSPSPTSSSDFPETPPSAMMPPPPPPPVLSYPMAMSMGPPISAPEESLSGWTTIQAPTVPPTEHKFTEYTEYRDHEREREREHHSGHTPLRNPLPEPPRDVYDMEPYRALRHNSFLETVLATGVSPDALFTVKEIAPSSSMGHSHGRTASSSTATGSGGGGADVSRKKSSAGGFFSSLARVGSRNKNKKEKEREKQQQQQDERDRQREEAARPKYPAIPVKWTFKTGVQPPPPPPSSSSSSNHASHTNHTAQSEVVISAPALDYFVTTHEPHSSSRREEESDDSRSRSPSPPPQPPQRRSPPRIHVRTRMTPPRTSPPFSSHTPPESPPVLDAAPEPTPFPGGYGHVPSPYLPPPPIDMGMGQLPHGFIPSGTPQSQSQGSHIHGPPAPMSPMSPLQGLQGHQGLLSPRVTSPMLTASPMPLPLPAPFGHHPHHVGPPITFSRHVYPHYSARFELASPHPIRFQGRIYPTAAHLLESLKFLHDSAADGGGPELEEMRERVRGCASVDEVREFVAGAPQEWVRGDWDQVVLHKVDEVLYLKVRQHAEIKGLLLGTGEAELMYVEEEERFWGAAENGGRNELGKALMRVRESLREGSEVSVARR